MRTKCLALLIVFGSAFAAFAESLPPMGYFAGRYEIVWRAADSAETFIGGHVRMTAEGDRLILSSETVGEGWLARNPSTREGASPLAGKLGGREMLCLFQNDPDNYPRLTCKTEPGSPEGKPGLLTFWPSPS